MLLAVDPGRTTGVFILEDGIGVAEQWIQSEVWERLLHCGKNKKIWITDKGIRSSHNLEVIVLERFVYQPRVKVDLTPVEVIGIVKQWAALHEVPVVLQTPAQAKHWSTDERLKEKGWYSKGLPHANDAARHMLYYLTFNGSRMKSI